MMDKRLPSWKPNLSQYPHKPGSNKLLWEAFNKFQPAHLIDKLEDDKGVFALNLDKGVTEICCQS